jgi:hypothetical protein
MVEYAHFLTHTSDTNLISSQRVWVSINFLNITDNIYHVMN